MYFLKVHDQLFIYYNLYYESKAEISRLKSSFHTKIYVCCCISAVDHKVSTNYMNLYSAWIYIHAVLSRNSIVYFSCLIKQLLGTMNVFHSCCFLFHLTLLFLFRFEGCVQAFLTILINGYLIYNLY